MSYLLLELPAVPIKSALWFRQNFWRMLGECSANARRWSVIAALAMEAINVKFSNNEAKSRTLYNAAITDHSPSIRLPFARNFWRRQRALLMETAGSSKSKYDIIGE